VIASNAASIPEVCGDAALYFSPLSVEELKSQLHRVLFEPNVADELGIKGDQQVKRYTWSKVAQTILNTVQALIQE
jgi:glycosyltransferase involved in cell wall biosynthesis